MRQVVVYALYGWCVISLIMLISYLVRRWRPASEVALSENGSTASSQELLIDDNAESSGTKTPETKLTESKPAEAKAASPEPGFVSVAEADLAAAPLPEPKPVAAVSPQAEPDTVEVPALSAISAAAAGDAAISGDTAGATGEGTSAAPPLETPPNDVPLDSAPEHSATPMAPTAGQKTLADLLEGFQLPHSLLPIIPDHADISERHVSLLTSTAPVEIVGPAVADELERLGYQLAPVSDNELLASRDDDQLKLTMVVAPTTVERGGRLVYPQANEGDVVITIEVVTS